MIQKSFSILGDSISSFVGHIPAENEYFYPEPAFGVTAVEDMWWSLLAERLNLRLFCNDSYSGARISRTGLKPPTSCYLDASRQRNLGGDYIIVFGGTNDWGNKDEPATLEVFTSAYQELIEMMVDLHTESAIYFCTPLQRLDRKLTTPNVHGWTQLDVAEVIRTAVARVPGAHLIDLASYSISETDNLLPDGVHPNRAGMQMLAKLMEAGLTG